MRKTLYILAALALGSCAKWLDVPPPTSVNEKELFKTEEGFQEAVNGLYNSAGSYNLYGGVFTMELLDAFMQNYTYDVTDSEDWSETSNFDFGYGMTRTRFNMIWNAGYSAIVNCNLVLKNLEEQRGSKIFSPDMQEIVEAEALALRGYIHFDMLRLCVPVKGTPAANAGRMGIPYVTTYSKEITPLSMASVALDKSIADLSRAKELLKGRDPILSDDYVVDYPTPSGADANAVTPEENIKVDGEVLPLFLQNRRHRMNYFAVCGALARAYLWKATAYGDASSFALAAENANEVITADKFKWTGLTAAYAPPTGAAHDREMYNEIIFGLFIDNAGHITELENRFNNLSKYYVDDRTLSATYELTGVGINDLRFVAWFTRNAEGDKTKILKYLRNSETAVNGVGGNLHYLIAPAIRLGEMYFIVAECIANGATVPGFADKWEPLTFVRTKREINTPYNTAVADFQTELLKEYRKETYAEGQAFLNYKRLQGSFQRESPLTFYGPTTTGNGNPNGVYSPKISDSNYDWLPSDETTNRI